METAGGKKFISSIYIRTTHKHGPMFNVWTLLSLNILILSGVITQYVFAASPGQNIINTPQKSSVDDQDFIIPESGPEAVFFADITGGKTLYIKNERVILNTEIPFGSLIKPFTLYYALSSGAVNAKKVFYCRPSKITDPPSTRCWYTPGHGRLNSVQALTQSCNNAFMKIASTIDYSGYLEFLESFNFDTDAIRKTESQLERQMIMTGLKDKLLTSPASLALKIAALMEGILYRLDEKKNLEIEKIIPLNTKTVDIIRGAMTMSMVEGHSVPDQDEQFLPLKIIGKTGTIGRFERLDSDCDKQRNNGIFVSLFRYQNRNYIIAVVKPCGIGDDAAKTARRIIHKFTSFNPGR